MRIRREKAAVRVQNRDERRSGQRRLESEGAHPFVSMMDSL